MSFTLATVQTASGPRAAIVVADRVLEIAAATGREEDRTILDILSHWDSALPRLDALVG